MTTVLQVVLQWFRGHDRLLFWLAVSSGAMLTLSAVALPWLVARLPADYFARDHHPAPWANHHPVLRMVLLALKNLAGVILLILGILMLILPGQGILTIIAGMALIDFPGRHALVQWIVSRQTIMGALNWLRRRERRPEFQAVQR